MSDPTADGTEADSNSHEDSSDEAQDTRLEAEERLQLKELTMTAVEESLDRLRDLRDQGFEFAKRSYPVRVLPGDEPYSIVEWTSAPDVPLHYRQVFGPSGGYKSKIFFEELPAIQALVEFVRQRPALASWLVPARIDDDQWRDHILTMGVADLPLEIVDRHIHIVGWDLNDEFTQATYLELEFWWLNSKLPVELWIPILGVTFDADSFDLPDDLRVVRLSQGEQLARWPGARLAGLEVFVAMATHALVVPGWVIGNPDALSWLAPTDPPEHVPHAENFLESLAMVTEEPSGYIQVVVRPSGWSPGYVGELPVMLAGPLIPDKRSTRLSAGHKPGVCLDAKGIAQLKIAYAAMSTSKEVSLAATRLLSAERRSSSADRIVDLCVGLEALVSDGQGETTYKIAIRAAAMLAKAGIPSPSSFIGPMKTVYAHRSAVVHGRGSAKTESVKVGGQTVSTEDLARDVLRKLLQVRMSDLSLTPDEVDRKLIGAALDQFAETTPSPDAAEGTGA